MPPWMPAFKRTGKPYKLLRSLTYFQFTNVILYFARRAST